MIGSNTDTGNNKDICNLVNDIAMLNYRDWKSAFIPEIHSITYTCTRAFGHF